MSDQCKTEVQDHTGWRWHRCSRTATKDGYCWQHHPDAIEERQEEAMRRLNQKLENSPLKKAIRRAEKAEARVAAGIAATNDKSEAYGLYAVGWNAALKHVRDVLENNDE